MHYVEMLLLFPVSFCVGKVVDQVAKRVPEGVAGGEGAFHQRGARRGRPRRQEGRRRAAVRAAAGSDLHGQRPPQRCLGELSNLS